MTRDRLYSHVVELLRERPWGLRPAVLGTIREIVNMHVRGERLSEDEIRDRVAAAQAQAGDRPGQSQAAGVAIVPLYGVILPKATLMTEFSGGTSVQGFMRMFRNALADSEVGAIVIDVDSPGGLTDLVPEAAAEIRAARGTKPMVSIANTQMASCAYWLGCQADEVVASPSSVVGSIGVWSEHFDISAAMEMEGVKHTYISAGKFKVEANQYEPLGDEAERHVQELVDDAYALFVNDVAKARGATAKEVRDGYGQGRILTPTMAKAEGLVDRIDTLESTIRRMVGKAARQPRKGAIEDVETWGENVGRAWVTAAAGTGDGAEIVEIPDPEPVPDPDPEPKAGFEFERELLARRRIPA